MGRPKKKSKYSRETSAERRLKKFLDKKKSLKYRQHQYIDGMEVDFLFPKQKLVVEVDGMCHLLPKKIRSDEFKTERLILGGYKLVRFTNVEVFENPRKCVSKIESLLGVS